MAIEASRAHNFAEVPVECVDNQDVWADNRSLSSRVGSAALRGLAYFGMALFMLVGTALTVGVLPIAAAVQKYRSQAKLETMVHKIALNRHKAVYQAVRDQNIQPISSLLRNLARVSRMDFNKLEGKPAEKAKLRQHAHTLLYLLQTARIDGSLDENMQVIRSHVDATLALPIYQRNKTQSNNYFIAVFQAATHAFVSESPGMKPMQEVGASAVRQVDGPITFGVVADRLEHAYQNFTIFKRVSKVEKIFWIFAHPTRFLASAMDQVGLTRAIDYNSFEHGNAAIKVGSFQVKAGLFGKSTYTLGQSPTHTGDRLTTEDVHARRLVQDLESNYNGHEGETGRVAAKEVLQDPTRLRHLNTPINLHKDGTETHAAGLDPKLQGIIRSAVEGSILKGELPAERAAQAQILAEVSLRGIQEMVKNPYGAGNHYINQSCKQNIDRGVIVNVMTILFADAISGTPVTEDRLHQVVGMVLGRAGMVDNRAILKKWLRPLKDLLMVLDQNPKALSEIQHHFGRGAIAFTASPD